MTKEGAIRRLLDWYDDEMALLAKDYDRRFRNVSVNQAGEANAREILELNAWHIQEKNLIQTAFIKAVGDL